MVMYSLAELDHEEALVEVGAAVGAADEVLLLVALVLAQRPLRLRAELEVLRLDICGCRKSDNMIHAHVNYREDRLQ